MSPVLLEMQPMIASRIRADDKQNWMRGAPSSIAMWIRPKQEIAGADDASADRNAAIARRFVWGEAMIPATGVNGPAQLI